MQNKPNNYFRAALFLSAVLALIMAVLLLWKGKTDSFLFINSHHNAYADIFFRFYTYAGDGMIWVPFGLYILIARREYWVLLIAGIIISTLLTHFLKRVVFADDLRPLAYFPENIIHLVKGVKMNRMHSFPSGHTAQAFTMALLIAYISNKRYIALLFCFLALLLGYSRVYLAQHFVTDVLAGTLTGIVAAWLSVVLYQWLDTKKRKKIIPG
ncbi:MAG: phosphatase PAP2 family protein [Terrimonas sp.]|nr:phosphatase PAP2 family protein [Terrimonas sp.]